MFHRKEYVTIFLDFSKISEETYFHFFFDPDSMEF